MANSDFPAGVAREIPARAAEETPAIRRHLDGLLGMLSHDLRTPLSAISGWLFLLESGKLDNDGQKRALAKIRSAIDEEVRLIDDTLAIARGRMGRLELETESIELTALVNEAVAAITPAAQAKGIIITFSGAVAPGTVVGDKSRLARAIESILAHAVTVSPAAGRVQVTIRATADALEVVVADSGPGVGPPDAHRLIEPFEQGPAGDLAAQVSIDRGILLAHALIAAHGGRLEIASPGVGQGKTLLARLPITGPSGVRR